MPCKVNGTLHSMFLYGMQSKWKSSFCVTEFGVSYIKLYQVVISSESSCVLVFDQCVGYEEFLVERNLGV